MQNPTPPFLKKGSVTWVGFYNKVVTLQGVSFQSEAVSVPTHPFSPGLSTHPLKRTLRVALLS